MLKKGPSPNRRNQRIDVCWWHLDPRSKQWTCWNLHALHPTGWAYVWVATEVEQNGTIFLLFQCDVKHKSKNPMEMWWFRRSRRFIWEVSCVTMAVLGQNWVDALALQGRNLKHCAVLGTTLFSWRQRRSKFFKFAYIRTCHIVCRHHGLTKPNWQDPIFSKQNVSGFFFLLAPF